MRGHRHLASPDPSQLLGGPGQDLRYETTEPAFCRIRMTAQDVPRRCVNPAQEAVLDGNGPRYTYMNETKNQTSHSPGTCGEASSTPGLRFRGGSAGMAMVGGEGDIKDDDIRSGAPRLAPAPRSALAFRFGELT